MLPGIIEIIFQNDRIDDNAVCSTLNRRVKPLRVLCKQMIDLTNSQLKSKMIQITFKCNQLFQGGIRVKVGRC